jgi:hypothetical protein
VVVCVPVGDEHTLRYLRTRQWFLIAALPGRQVAWLPMLASLYIARQERRVEVPEESERSLLAIR